MLRLPMPLIRIATMVLFVLPCAAGFGYDAPCYATPTEAAAVASKQQSTKQPHASQGYRIASIHHDPLLGAPWAVIVSCERPELAPIMVPLPSTFTRATASGGPFPLVHTGDVVHIFSHNEMLHLELTGIAEGSGTVGEHIRVHMLGVRMQAVQHPLGFGGHPLPMVAVIRGPNEVEIDQ